MKTYDVPGAELDEPNIAPTEPEIMKPDECYKFVIETSRQALMLINARVQQCHPKQQFLLRARTVGLIFDNVFMPLINWPKPKEESPNE